jgi:CYTH domain-containing protein
VPGTWTAEPASSSSPRRCPPARPGYVRGLITNTYLSAAGNDLLASLPGEVLSKTRLSVPPFSIDVFDPPLRGLVLGEAEFATDQAARSFPLPAAAIAEITDDTRFTAGTLAHTRRHDLLAWLGEYGIKLEQTEPR